MALPSRMLDKYWVGCIVIIYSSTITKCKEEIFLTSCDLSNREERVVREIVREREKKREYKRERV